MQSPSVLFHSAHSNVSAAELVPGIATRSPFFDPCLPCPLHVQTEEVAAERCERVQARVAELLAKQGASKVVSVDGGAENMQVGLGICNH